ncbi:hypothetical protein QBC33DRAFT_517170 [Phialemonium atrogriseum]|uniref:C2H2-type domain-containing protein n=1 Tax=Phialemonium atrogriseum TaxID=1093897 RepID=A0AAJ0BVD4_9PEZI|nr:uncharacterized protein QBC33DRAFT_517170 [Phialemonium atrogriseum]KAK1764956.1 hypothetical protein QBC33DRAFT_517170 [Phialemonium atrogriseum]
MTHDTSAVVEAVPAERRSLFGTTEVGSGSWNDVPGRKGLNPLNRPLGEAIASVNEMAMRRQVEEKNHEVDDWLGHSSFALEDNVGRHDTSHSRDEMSPVVTDDWGPRTPPTSDIFVGVDDREPSLGDETENKPLPGQTYFIEDGPELSTVDLSLMRETAPWQDAPALFKIENVGEAKLLSQPETSHAAIARFESMCDDNNSVVSRAATWGTRRRTVPELDDIEGITSGLFLKKLSLGSRTQSKPSAFDGVRSLLKRSPPYAFLKRARTKEPEDGLVGMWKTLGGPPVPSLSTVPKPAVTEPDNEDDGESDLGDGDSGSLEPEIATSDFFKGCIPDFDRFRQHARKLNPMLSHTNAYLLDNVAHHQTARFDSLVSARTKHVSDVETQNCPSRFCCIALGGGPRLLHAKGDPTTTINVKDSDEEADPVPGTFRVAEENFSKGIPMPPTEGLPAQLECQTCYKVKTIWRPSDWTRHIIEDLQPYVCTYDGCLRRFKRKVDWARHENEVHRHHGWWACDEKDCRHKSYRRDDFLQHLVREHNLTAPKANTGGPTKRAGSTDPITWQKVEKCHHQSRSKPHDEPCRFCGKAFTTWKKLTDHLAKHMEEIALPLLSLVAREDLTPDNFVSPVDSPPPAPSRHGDSILASRAFFEHFTPVSPTINEKTPDRYAQMASQKDYMPDLSCDSGISMDPNGKGPSDECPGQSSSEEEPTDAETPGQLSAESHYSKSQREVENLDHRPARQVGIARIRVELLSVSRPGDGYDSEASEPLSADEGEGPVDDDGQRGEEESGNNPGSSGSSPGNPSSNTVQGPSGGSGSSGNGQQDSGSNERGSGGRGGGRKRRRQNSPDAAMKKTIQRFACPYQVYEPFQGCLGRGPRNPKGGCDGIYRLRQHLSRRHMLSSRCPTCWRSFDTKTKQDEHIKIAKCQERPRPVGELFMDTDHESEVEKPCGSMSEEDTWWKLFRLLIPGMETRDFCWLNTHYYPYYIAYDVSMTIPTLNFINTSFSQPQPETSTGDVSTTNG